MTPQEKAIKNVLADAANPFHSMRGSQLLKSVKILKKPKWADMRDDERLLHAVLVTYIKHHMNIDIIGWNELGELLHDAICQNVGDDEFCRWSRMIADAEEIEI